MILPRPNDALHRAWLFRVLERVASSPFLVSVLYFKGGTCAAMRGWLDRFSVDLDFDFMGRPGEMRKTKRHLEDIFRQLGLEIKDASQKAPQYFLRHPVSQPTQRNTLKIDVSFPPLSGNEYELVRFIEIDRFLYSPTQETMVANKMVALVDRFKKRRKIAARDLYDLHYFFQQGFSYRKEVIERYSGKKAVGFLKYLSSFIKKRINQRIIDQDLNFLLPPEKFKAIRKTLKKETLLFLENEIRRLEKGYGS